VEVNHLNIAQLNQDNPVNQLFIGMPAPDFTANTTFGPMQMSSYLGKWVVLFSHPGAFTPVCTTEFLTFAKTYPTFQAMNTELIGLNIGSNAADLAWVYSIYEGNNVEIPFPIIADRMGDIARLYGMIPMESNLESTVRNVFFIDPNQIIRAMIIYPATTGRNINEIIRVVQALQTTDQYQVLTPANWYPGNPVVVPAPSTYDELIQRETNPQALGLTCLNSYWCYKDINTNGT